jgi:IMP cyclohydrolase
VRPVDLFDTLSGNTYPGRGILLGRIKEYAVMAYFIMGRSENSRNRVFVTWEGGIRTEAFDPDKLTDPTLIIYAPVRVVGDQTIVTNGDQTDTVAEYLKAGRTFEDALRTRTFEPDAPNFTPRISGLISVKNGKCDYRLSIQKSGNGNPDNAQRFFFEYPEPAKNEGHLIHTYRQDGNPIPSFEGEPVCVKLPEMEMDAFAQKLWDNLNPGNRVSLFLRYVRLSDGKTDSCIINKNRK